MKKLFIFDYDRTIAQPVSVPSKEMLHELEGILEGNIIAIMSGGRTYDQVNALLIKNLSRKKKLPLQNFYVAPFYGNTIFQWDAETPILKYKAEEMAEETKNEIYNALRGIQEGKSIGGELNKMKTIDKGQYISINCLGGAFTKEEREAWDTDKVKRQKLKNYLDGELQGKLEVYVTGRATVDIIPKGKNKAENSKRLAKMLDIELKNVLYFGDEFEVYGNDYPLLSVKGIHINVVKNPEETLEILKPFKV